ncbi:MAG: MFS transporter [Anaerolineae bacterium]|nr:MFS transporter [Anaerolineae bacterium]
MTFKSVKAGEKQAGWLWLLTLFSAASFIEVTVYGQLGAFTPIYLPQFGIPVEAVPQWTGLIAGLSSGLGIPFLPFWGALADRYRRQPVIVRSFAALLTALVVMRLSGNIWTFILGRSVTSLAWGNTGLMMTTLSERTPRGRLGLAFGILNGAGPVGAFLGPLLGGPIVDRWGFPTLLVVDAGLMALVCRALTVGYHDPYGGVARGSMLTMAAESVTVTWRSRQLRALFPALFLLLSGWMMGTAFAPLVVTALYQGDDVGTVVGWVIGLGGLTSLALSPVVGALADRFGHWRVLLIGAALTILLWPLPALTHSLTGFTVAWAVLNGVASGVFALSFTVLAGAAAPDIRGRVMAFAYLPLNVGGLFGPALGSLVTRLSLFAIFPTAAVLTALGLAALVVAARRATDPLVPPGG